MTISPTVRDFPSIPVSKQLFYVPGGALQGGLTSGGAQIITPEPGGFGVLEIQPSLQVGEWQSPFSSWLMSQGNGQILRVQLTRTPQLLTSKSLNPLPTYAPTYSMHKAYSTPIVVNDLVARFTTIALEGSTQVVINMAGIGNRLREGHVIGHENNTYIVDQIEYDANNVATVIINPPLRKDIAVSDFVHFRPYFIGRIANVSEILTTYDSDLWGSIQIGKIILNEANI